MTAILKESNLNRHLQHLGTSHFGTNQLPIKIACWEVPATTDAGDIIDVNLTNAGITTMWGIDFYTHSTTDSVIVTTATEVGETSVSSGVLRVHVPLGQGDNAKRVLQVWGA